MRKRMNHVMNRPHVVAFFDELDIGWTEETKGRYAGMISVPEADVKPDEEKAWSVFEEYARRIERLKFDQARKNNPVGYEFPIYDHPAVFTNKNGESVFAFTPYHSISIIGFMPLWMHLSENPWYMGERTIYAKASEIPETVDEEEIARLALLPPLDEKWGTKTADLDNLRISNAEALLTGTPFITGDAE